MSVHIYNYDGKVANSPEKYGQRYWGVILKDGRQVMFHADKVVVSGSGELIAVRTHEPALNSSGEHVGRYKLLEESYSTLGFAKGEWLSYFSANVFSGDPVSIDNSEEFIEEK